MFAKDINYGSRSKEIIELQKRLKEEGFFEYPYYTEYYGPVTRKAVLEYQLSKKIINSPYDLGAGRLGPSTRESLNK
jgi:peptidoglycan hydrolase-like protein with peptidoglycan-binding domain